MNNNTDKQILLVGSHIHTMDDKKRIIFPSIWRNLLEKINSLYIFPHPEKPCLHLYLKDEMNRRLHVLRNDEFNEYDDNVIRNISSTADIILLDSQGRLRLKDNLLRHIDIKNKIVFIGLLTRIEIWSLEKFDSLIPMTSNKAEDLFFSGY